MKKFIYDQIIDKTNICNMEKEVEIILKNIENKNNTVIFAPRNYGKTSVIQNIIIPEFKAKNKQSFILFVDFLGVDDNLSIINKLIISFEKAFADTFPVKNLVKSAKEYLKGFSPQIQIDTLTGDPTLSLFGNKKKDQYSIPDIFNLVKSLSLPTLIILDEFQDISKIKSADAEFRTAFQALNIPIIIMGSQRQMLIELFSLPRAPLASFGIDVEFEPIAYEKYHDYIQERFNNIKITEEVTTHIQNLMDRVPEPINIFCDYILQQAIDNKLKNIETLTYVNNTLASLLKVRRKRFQYILYNLSSSEQKILIEIARLNGIDKPNSKEFITKTGVTARGINYTLNKLYHNAILDKIENKYFIADPLLKYYLIENS